MPQRKGQRKPKRNARGPRQIAAVPSQPRSMFVTFPWATQLTLTESAAGVGEVYVFRLNSLFDPNSTGVGDQPVGYDQWGELFRRSVVYATEVTLDAMVTTAVNTPSVIGCFPLVGASSVPTGISMDSQYGCVNKIRSNGTVPLNLKKTFDVARMMGISRDRLFSEEDYSEAMLAGPAVSSNRQLLLYIYTRGYSTVSTASFRLRFRFHARLFEPKCLPNS